MVAATKALGFEGVYDMNLTADLTIMEEADGIVSRIQNGGPLPLITSCSPGWIKFCEHYFPEMTENLSTCKSPQQMFGALFKTYYAEKMGWDPRISSLFRQFPAPPRNLRWAEPARAQRVFPMWTMPSPQESWAE